MKASSLRPITAAMRRFAEVNKRGSTTGRESAAMCDRAILAEVFSPSSVLDPENIVHSHWLEHGPFALFLMEALRPKIFVELGTHHGFSYFCFCQSANQFDTGTQCYAVDTWKGDRFTGSYGEQIFNCVQLINKKYSEFSRLLRTTFDDALSHFSDGSVDLLILMVATSMKR